ncbi:MAG: RNA methyltransferase [Bacteroidales bacterium]
MNITDSKENGIKKIVLSPQRVVQGRVKRNEELGRLSVQEFKQTEKWPVTLILDNVRSLHNVGSAFRSGDAFAIEKLYLCGITACPPHREIQKTALGATESVFWTYEKNTVDLVNRLKAEAYKIYAVEQVENSISLENFFWEKNEKIALVFGNEVDGISQEVVDVCTGAIEIPQFGTKHSLNVSVSIGVVLWEIRKNYLRNESRDNSLI